LPPRRGDAGTRGRGDAEIAGRWDGTLRVPASDRLRVWGGGGTRGYNAAPCRVL
jgi:hypothetical protein